MSQRTKVNVQRPRFPAITAALALALALTFVHCGKDKPGKDSQAQAGCPAAPGGTPWVPEIPGAADANHDADATVTRDVQTIGGPLTGLTQGATAAREISFTIPVEEDLGPDGSLSLVAELKNLPSVVEGGAYPFLVSLHDGVQELLQLPRAGTAGDCGAGGYFACTGDHCSPRPGCQLQAGSAYFNHAQWLSRQTGVFGYYSVNSFPTCNWAAGTPACPFNAGLFAAGTRLRSGPGVKYTAKYVLISDMYFDIPLEYRAEVKLTALKKKTAGTTGGALDLNIVLVGSKNVEASRTARGRQNLNLLLQHVSDTYGQPGVGIRLGQVRAFEWSCADGGDAHASQDASKLGQLFQEGATRVTPESANPALNIYIVSGISDVSVQKNLTTLGMSGGIVGPMVSGTGGSGLVFASLNHLDKFNADCAPGEDCPPAKQDLAFIEMGSTMAHEMGHFLGLNHPSELDGKTHDLLPDTPACTKTQNIRAGVDLLTVESCKDDPGKYEPTGKSCAEVCAGYDGKDKFCALQAECEFNHVMWWTTKNFNPAGGTGDGELFSPDSAAVIRYSPFVR